MSYTIEYLPPPKNYIGRALQKLVESLHAGKPHRGLNNLWKHLAYRSLSEQ